MQCYKIGAKFEIAENTSLVYNPQNDINKEFGHKYKRIETSLFNWIHGIINKVYIQTRKSIKKDYYILYVKYDNNEINDR